jgi:hypothetical protein
VYGQPGPERQRCKQTERFVLSEGLNAILERETREKPSPRKPRCDNELGMLLCEDTQGFRRMLVGALLFCQVLPAIAGDNPQAGQDAETTPLPPYPPAAIKAKQDGNVRLRITLEKRRILDVVTMSGPPALALPSARWVKAHWKLRPDISGVYDMTSKFSFSNPEVNAAAFIRIIVKDGRIFEVTPVGGSPAVGAAAADLVKKKWEFSASANLIVLLPVEIQKAK